MLEAFLKDFAGWSITEVLQTGKSDEGTLYMPYVQDITKDGKTEYISGTWQTYDPNFYTTAPADATVINIITVKGSTSFSVHYYDPAAFSCTWNVGYLSDAGGSGKPPALSHFSAYISAVPVPEPSTIFLVAIGLAGASGSRFRRRK